MLDQLPNLTTLDQADIRMAVELVGGRYVKGFWAANACLVEVNSARLPELLSYSRVARIQPNLARGPASIVLPAAPIRRSGGSDQHNFVTTHNPGLYPAHDVTRVKGLGITIGFLDTGLDLNENGVHNQVFGGPGGSRLLGSTLVPGSMPDPCTPGSPPPLPAIDCNSPGVHPFYYLYVPAAPPPKTSLVIHRDARHGTGMASVALGYQVFEENPVSTRPDGHAPEAFAVGWSISRGYPLANQGCFRWIIDAVVYLDAIQMIMDSIANGSTSLQILSMSYDGFPDPADAVNEAFDDLADSFDVLIVSAAGNTFDSTWASHGLHNGLSVGAVRNSWHGDPPVPSPPFEIFDFSARGPIQSEYRRFFPDVCAVGQGELAHIDRQETTVPPHPNHPTQQYVSAGYVPGTLTYTADGTSVAAPQVAGAAALYMSRRDASPPAASALETRAAILLNVLDKQSMVAPNPPISIDTYKNRNAYGVGFVRDDFLVEYAERFGNAQSSYATRNGTTLLRSQEMVTLTTGTPVQSQSWAVSGPDEYVVAIAWNKRFGEPLFNVDLEVWTTGAPQVRIAQSNSAGNSYERVAFKVAADGNQTVEIRVVGRDLSGSAVVPVHIAARRHPGLGVQLARRIATTGTVEEIPQPPCLVATNPNQVVDRVVPVGYAHPDGRPRAYGSGPFTPGASQVVGIRSDTPVHYIYGADAMGSSQFTANSVSLRLWRELDNTVVGLNGTSITLQLLGLAHTTSTQPSIPVAPYPGFLATYPSGVMVVQNRSIDIVHPAVLLNHPATPGGGQPWRTPLAHGYDSWPIRIPFDQVFTYNPANGNLAVWWDASFASGAPATYLRVDSLVDFWTTNCWMTEGSPLASPIQGRCPVLGFSNHTTGGLNDPPVLQRPRLHVLGEPATGEWLWFWTSGFGGPRLGGPPPSGNQFLLLGTQMPPPQSGSCEQFYSLGDLWSPGTPFFIPVPVEPDGKTSQLGFFLPDVPAVLYTDMFAQAVQVDGASVQLSSGLKLRIGGRLP